MKIFERQSRNKKAQEISVVVKLVVGLVVVGILIYIGYKYILGTGESVGKLGSCASQGGSGSGCISPNGTCTDGKKIPGVGCPDGANKDLTVCCVKDAK